MKTLQNIYKNIIEDEQNAWAREKGWAPIYTAHQEAKIMIIGQAPGRLAQESGVPWDDPSGRNLRNWMGVTDEMFYDETKIALIPMDFYFPGSGKYGDAPPRIEFAKKWHPLILANLKHIELTLLIGGYAQKHYLVEQKARTLTETVRNYKKFLPDIFPLVHPSPRNNIWHKKNPWFKDELVADLQMHVSRVL